MERVLAATSQGTECRCERHELVVCRCYSTKCSGLSPGQRKLRSADIAGEAAIQWHAMDEETKAVVTDAPMEELKLAQEEADTKPKITPAHILNDVSTTVAKIKREVCFHNPVDGHSVHIE